MATLSFADQVRRWGVEGLDRIDRVRRASILELFSLVVGETPVDTGHLRGNWQVAINQPKRVSIDRDDPSGEAVRAEIRANLGSMLDVVYMTNNLPYAERIEYEGYSRQAPSGMMRVNAIKWARIVEARAKAELSR